MILNVKIFINVAKRDQKVTNVCMGCLLSQMFENMVNKIKK